MRGPRTSAPPTPPASRTPAPSSPTASSSTPGASTCSTCSSPTPTRPPSACRSASSPTSPSGARRTGRTRGRCSRSSRPASTSAPRRTTSTSAARTGRCRRGARTGSPRPGTHRCATCSSAVLRHADGVRIDHVAGLWRLWWIPPGRPATEGTYVSYDARGDARRPGDRGHAGRGDRRRGGPRHRRAGGHRGARGARDARLRGALVRARRGRRPPPAPGVVGDEPRHDLDPRPPDRGGVPARRARPGAGRPRACSPTPRRPASRPSATARSCWRCSCPRACSPRGTPTRSGSSRRCTRCWPGRRRGSCWPSFTDVLDEPRQPNLPGTTDAYPNWRIPLPLSVEELLRDPRVQATVAGAAEPVSGRGPAPAPAPRPPWQQRHVAGVRRQTAPFAHRGRAQSGRRSTADWPRSGNVVADSWW